MAATELEKLTASLKALRTLKAQLVQMRHELEAAKTPAVPRMTLR